jgi:hypothetical protein
MWVNKINCHLIGIRLAGGYLKYIFWVVFLSVVITHEVWHQAALCMDYRAP